MLLNDFFHISLHSINAIKDTCVCARCDDRLGINLKQTNFHSTKHYILSSVTNDKAYFFPSYYTKDSLI